MTSKHDKAVIARLMRIKGATIQGKYQGPKYEPIVPISVKCERCGFIFVPTPSGNCPQCDLIQEVPEKPRKKPEPTGLAGTKVGRNVLMVDNKNVKPGGVAEVRKGDLK